MGAGLVDSSTRAAARAGVGAVHVTIAQSKGAIGLGTRVPDYNVLHIIEREGVASIDEGKKFLVSLLVLSRLRAAGMASDVDDPTRRMRAKKNWARLPKEP